MSGNPILERLCDYIREDTAMDITIRAEGGKYFVTFAEGARGEVLGPMDHGQCWYALLGMKIGRDTKPTLDTEKRREQKRFAEAVAKDLARTPDSH